MPVERGLHATAVAIGDRALLIRGASRAGKSRLAVALVARSTATRPILLVGDDRILLHRATDGLVARPHPRIAGFIERRGLGLVAMPWVAEARLGGVVSLCGSGTATPDPERHAAAPQSAGSAVRASRDDGDDLGELAQLVVGDAADGVRADRVLAWWAGLTAAWAQHAARNAPDASRAGTKD